jgi:hypothetical protein
MYVDLQTVWIPENCITYMNSNSYTIQPIYVVYILNIIYRMGTFDVESNVVYTLEDEKFTKDSLP